jgi:hypothetical protein
MKQIDYLYFNIYSYFHNTGACKQSYNARFQAMYLFALGLGGWLLFLQALYLHANHSRFSSRGESTLFAAAIFMLTGLLSHYIFIVKERDMEIFGKYEALSGVAPKRKMHFLISLSILLLPYLALLFFAIFYPRYGQFA